MRPDETYREYPLLASARQLQRAGRWDQALDVLAAADDPAARDLSADLLADRHSWRLDDRTEALAAIEAVRAGNEPLAILLTAQVDYTARLFRLNAPPDTAGPLRDAPDLVADPVEDFLLAAKAADDTGLRDWALFWYAVSTENVRDDTGTARPVYAEVAARATERDEPLLASYANRHLGALALYEDGDRETGLELLRRSVHERAAVGARPQIAAQQSLLAMALDDIAAAGSGTTPTPGAGAPGATPESAALRALVRRTAHELDLTWLK
jgi:hypothetical protein